MDGVFALFVAVGTLLLYLGMGATNLWKAKKYARCSLRNLKQEEERSVIRQARKFYQRWLKKNYEKIARCWRIAFIEVMLINILQYWLTSFKTIGFYVGCLMMLVTGGMLVKLIVDLVRKKDKIFDDIGEATDIVLLCVPVLSLALLMPINVSGWKLEVFLVMLTNIEMAGLMWIIINMNSTEKLEEELNNFLKYAKNTTSTNRKEFRSRKRINKAAISLK